jgi:hypothetical protein
MNNNTNWIGDLVAKVLTSGGVPEKKHSMHVGHVLEMSSTAATKKLAGGSEWRVQQLLEVVHSVGMRLDDFFDFTIRNNLIRMLKFMRQFGAMGN